MRKLRIAFLAGVLLVTIGIRQQIGKRDNPPVTTSDLKLRNIVQKSSLIQFGNGGKRFSEQQKQMLIAHLWVASASSTATYPPPSGQVMEIRFALSPGQGRIDLHPDAAWSGVQVEHWASQPGFGGSPPITINEENFALHPASNRFLRDWLSAGAP